MNSKANNDHTGVSVQQVDVTKTPPNFLRATSRSANRNGNGGSRSSAGKPGRAERGHSVESRSPILLYIVCFAILIASFTHGIYQFTYVWRDNAQLATLDGDFIPVNGPTGASFYVSSMDPTGPLGGAGVHIGSIVRFSRATDAARSVLGKMIPGERIHFDLRTDGGWVRRFAVAAQVGPETSQRLVMQSRASAWFSIVASLFGAVTLISSWGRCSLLSLSMAFVLSALRNPVGIEATAETYAYFEAAATAACSLAVAASVLFVSLFYRSHFRKLKDTAIVLVNLCVGYVIASLVASGLLAYLEIRQPASVWLVNSSQYVQWISQSALTISFGALIFGWGGRQTEAKTRFPVFLLAVGMFFILQGLALRHLMVTDLIPVGMVSGNLVGLALTIFAMTYASLRHELWDFGENACDAMIKSLGTIVLFVPVNFGEDWLIHRLGSIWAAFGVEAGIALAIGVTVHFVFDKFNESIWEIIFRRIHPDRVSRDLRRLLEASTSTENVLSALTKCAGASVEAPAETWFRSRSADKGAFRVAVPCVGSISSLVEAQDPAIDHILATFGPVDLAQVGSKIDGVLVVPISSWDHMYGFLSMRAKPSQKGYKKREVQRLVDMARLAAARIEYLEANATHDAREITVTTTQFDPEPDSGCQTPAPDIVAEGQETQIDNVFDAADFGHRSHVREPARRNDADDGSGTIEAGSAGDENEGEAAPTPPSSLPEGAHIKYTFRSNFYPPPV